VSLPIEHEIVIAEAPSGPLEMICQVGECQIPPLSPDQATHRLSLCAVSHLASARGHDQPHRFRGPAREGPSYDVGRRVVDGPATGPALGRFVSVCRLETLLGRTGVSQVRPRAGREGLSTTPRRLGHNGLAATLGMSRYRG